MDNLNMNFEKGESTSSNGYSKIWLSHLSPFQNKVLLHWIDQMWYTRQSPGMSVNLYLDIFNNRAIRILSVRWQTIRTVCLCI